MTPSDEELVQRCKAELPHTTKSYEILVQRYMNRVYNNVYQVVDNKEDAEDVTQEVFVKVYNGLKSFELRSSFASWIYRIAINSALDALERIKRERAAMVNRQQRQGQQEILQQRQPSETGPEERILQAELRRCINQVLQKLDRDQASVLVMRDFHDFSYDEIARSVGAGLSAIKMRIHRARLAFQEVFNQLCEHASLIATKPVWNSAKGANGKRQKNDL